MKKCVFWGLVTVPTVVAIVALSCGGVMYNRIKNFDNKYKCDVLAGLSAEECRQQLPSEKKGSAQAPAVPPGGTVATNPVKKVVLEVVRVDYDDDTELRVVFNERPDMDVVRQYFRVGPMAAGKAGFRYVSLYNHKRGLYEPTVFVTGEFAYRTNLTLKVRRGFPLHGGGASADEETSLAEDFSYGFRRNDPAPSVAFADDGRYLPPGGRKALRIEAVSVTNIATEIRRVEPRNVVQLLAREERVYRRTRWSDDTADVEDTEELAGLCETGVIRCVNRPCEKEVRLFPVSMNDGGPQNGIFLTAVRNGDRERYEYRWRNRNYNPNLYRLVCLSDLGLSVRQDKDGLGVWVTSLLTGRPVSAVRIELYSAANVLIASGDSDADGWCVPERCAKGEPFAVVAYTQEDMSFLALRDSMKIDETYEDGAREAYLGNADTDAFVWTERGIYRHGEKIFVHALIRDGSRKAPKPMPVTLALLDPEDRAFASTTVLADADGAIAYEGFAVPHEQPSGKWKVVASLPGKKGRTLAEREIRIEEFAPPQIRVAVEADETRHPSNFAFRVSAEHLFGGPARALACEGAVVFEDVPFAPAGWKGFVFGNEELGLKPCFRRLSARVLDDKGLCSFEAPLWAASGLPRAAVRATGQGVVFEDGGRPATARKSVVCHYYPMYVGSDLASWLKRPKTGRPKVRLVCVDPKGSLVKGERKLVGKIDRIDSFYSYRKTDDGTSTWDCDRVRSTVMEDIPISVASSGLAEYELPLDACGDYVFTATDPATGASFGRSFYLSDWGDDVVRAPLSNPTKVTIRTDKSFYRVGERPRLVVKAPFAGFAMLSVMREKTVYTEILNLTNATSEVVLRPVERDWAPNVDVAVSVVQSVGANAKHLAARAHGLATVCVRPVENEIGVRLSSRVEMKGVDGGAGESGSRVTVDVEAKGADAVVVTLVDEGINLLTDERTPDPVRWLARARAGERTLFDLFNRILPVADDGLKASGVKTGGDCGAEMLGRVSPVPTRRFRPLALWKAKVDVLDGKARAVFDLPEFVGEVRLTAVAYSATATGAASVQQKVTPRLVMQPDAPRFVAPWDAFDVTLPLRNRSGGDGDVEYAVALGEDVRLAGRVKLAKDGSTNVVARLRAPERPGELAVRFSAAGLEERHVATILVPVRPAVAWRERTEVVRLEPGQSVLREREGDCSRFAVTVGASPMAELASAMEWLAEYPHGCLEQTASRIFPLIAADGILNTVAARARTSRADFVAAGVRRVESMVRENDFVMWPDCTYAPWDREVSLYAAHFLVEAERAGQKLEPAARNRVFRFLKRWALGTNDCESAYACHTLALAGQAEKDRMLRLYDRRERMDALSRARLARAFAAVRDRARAEALMKYEIEPQSVREAAFRVLALLELDPDDPRIVSLVAYLTARRDKTRFSWGTTGENAHALLAIGAYYRHHPAKEGEVRVGELRKRDSTVVEGADLCLTNTGTATAFLSVRAQWLGDARTETDEANGIFITRRYFRADGSLADLANLVRGEMLVAELTVTSDVTRVVGDLVIEDLFAGAFEPVHREIGLPPTSASPQVADWVMRKDARDDRMLVFSKRFELKKDHEAKVFYPVRVVSAGDFVLPGPSVEGMYHPELRARRAPGRLVVRP